MDLNISDFLQEFDKISRRGKCKSCQKPVGWSRSHLAAHKRATCASATPDEKRRFAKRPSNNFDASNDSSSDNSFEVPSGHLSVEQIKNINSKLAQFFFRTGISIRLADSEAFKDLVTALNPTYAQSMPTARSLSGSLLDDQYSKCVGAVQEILEESHNLTLISDGWTNIRGDHIVNFCVKAPNNKPFFHSSVNTSGIAQNAQAVADEIMKVVEQVGAEKFSSVVTDNAAVMKAAWKIIEQKHPHITAMGCAAHTMNLLIKDILGSNINQKTIKESEKIIKFVMNHHIVKAKFEVLRKQANIPHTLSMAVVTRWYSRYTSLSNLSASRYVLIQLVGEAEDILRGIQPTNSSASVINLIKSDDFWNRLSSLAKTIEYPANIIGKLSLSANCYSLKSFLI